jgi:hypothetical protein
MPEMPQPIPESPLSTAQNFPKQSKKEDQEEPPAPKEAYNQYHD